MATEKIYAWGSGADDANVILNEVVNSALFQEEHTATSFNEALKDIDEYFSEDCYFSAEPERGDFTIFEITINIEPKSKVKKTGVVVFTTEVEKI